MARRHDKNVVQYLPPSQVAQVVARAEDQAYDRGFIDGHNRAAVTLMKYRDLLEQMKLSLVHIDSLWSVPKAPKEFMFGAMKGKDKLLKLQWSAFFSHVLTMDPAPDYEQIKRFGDVIDRYTISIQLFLAKKDDGSELRTIAEEKPSDHPIRQLRAFASSINLGGPKNTGMRPWRRRLGELIVEMTGRSPNLPLWRIGSNIRSRLEDEDIRTPDENKIIETLNRETRQDAARMERYIGDVLNDYLAEIGES